MNKRFGWCGVLCLASLAWMHALAADKPASPKKPKRTATVIENCITPSDTLSFRPGDNGSLLDEVDRFQVAAEIVRRYPMIERDGLYPSAIALWRRKDGDWVFATMIARPEPPHPLCFTANVAISEVQIAPALLKKYFGIPVAPI
ncbi:MAG TPA: hypothetical protein VHQ87_18820 [Rhizobacter sp.]|nr:hypothetical protein [Rhizobacter sp.]